MEVFFQFALEAGAKAAISRGGVIAKSLRD
jgi:hypothetical protein